MIERLLCDRASTHLPTKNQNPTTIGVASNKSSSPSTVAPEIVNKITAKASARRHEGRFK